MDRPRRRHGGVTGPGAPAREWTGKLARVLGSIITSQWEALERQHATLPPPTPSARNRLLGLYLVVTLTLVTQNFAVEPGFLLVPEAWRLGPHGSLLRRVWWAWTIAALYVVPAGIYARSVLGMGRRDLGLDPSRAGRHAWLYAAGYGIVLPFVVAASRSPAFLATYPFHDGAASSWTDLLLWEGSYAAQFVALEFFFRGVMLFCAFRVLGPWAIPAMVLPYTMIHFGKPAAECIGAIVAGSALGLVALRTGAIWAGMVIHIGVAWTMDLLALWHEGGLQDLLARTWSQQ